MTVRVRRYLQDLRAGFRVLASAAFWREFRAYYAPTALATRMDAWTAAQKARRR